MTGLASIFLFLLSQVQSATPDKQKFNLQNYMENRLETGFSGCKTPQKRKFKKSPVTLIIGIICKDGIVLAADSQTTKGVAKQPGTQKIREAKFSNGVALIAESGSASLSNSVIELFQNKANGKQIENELTVAKLAEESVREIRKSITSLHPEKNAPEDWQNYFLQDANYFELMVAYYFDGKPHIYKLNPLWCIPVPATSYFMTSGIASDLANYILTEHTEPKMSANFAWVVAIKVVKDAIEYVEGCGSPPRVACLWAKSQVASYEMSKSQTDLILNMIARVDLKTKSTWNKKILTGNKKVQEALRVEVEEVVILLEEAMLKVKMKDPVAAASPTYSNLEERIKSLREKYKKKPKS